MTIDHLVRNMLNIIRTLRPELVFLLSSGSLSPGPLTCQAVPPLLSHTLVPNAVILQCCFSSFPVISSNNKRTHKEYKH